MIVNRLGHFTTNTGYPSQVIDPSPLHGLQATKAAEQLLTPFWPHTGHLLQHRLLTGLSAPRTVTSDGKPMRLVANLLNQMQRRGILWQYRRRISTPQEQLLFAGLTGHPFSHRH